MIVCSIQHYIIFTLMLLLMFFLFCFHKHVGSQKNVKINEVGERNKLMQQISAGGVCHFNFLI